MSDTIPADQQTRFSLWLCPEASSAAPIQSTIEHLALKHASLAFEPHMTICTGLTDNLDVIESKLVNFASISKPLFLNGAKFSHRPMFYQSLFIELKLDGDLQHFQKHALQALDQLSPKDFYPHVSLAYIDPDEFDPIVEITQLSETLLLKTRYDRLKLMETSGYQKNWKEIIEVELDGQ